MKPTVLVLHLPGTNRDHDVAEACALAGGKPVILGIDSFISGDEQLSTYQMLVLPGGFSYGDDLGAGRVWAATLRHQLRDQMSQFVASGKPVLGICNGFQALIKAGLFPLDDTAVWSENRPATLTHNASGKFECRWVELEQTQKAHVCLPRGLQRRFYVQLHTEKAAWWHEVRMSLRSLSASVRSHSAIAHLMDKP